MVVRTKKLPLIIFMALLVLVSYIFLSTKFFLATMLMFCGIFFVLYDIKIGLCLMAFAYPFLPDIIGLLGFLSMGFVIFLRKILLDQRDFTVDIYGLSIGFFIVLALANTLTSVNVGGSIRDLGLNCAGVSFVFAMVNSLRKKEDINVFVSVLMVSVLMVALVGIRQIFTGVVMRPEWTDVENSQDIAVRIYSVFTNPNIFAEYLVMTIPLGVGLMWYTKSMKKKMLFMAGVGLLLIALVMTMSRGGWLGIFVAAFIFVLIVDKRLLLLSIPIILIMIPFLPKSILERFISIGSNVDSSILYRTKIYDITFHLIKDNFINGVGFGYIPFKQVFETYIRTMPIYHAHNTFLEIFAEGGIIGLLVFLYMIFSILKNANLYLAKSDDKYIKYLGAGAIASLFGILANGMTEHILYMPRIIFTFWILIGIIISLIRISKNEKLELTKKENLKVEGVSWKKFFFPATLVLITQAMMPS